MKKIWTNSTAIIAKFSPLILLFQLSPVHAASFEFRFFGSNESEQGNGILKFEGSPLTEVGAETAKLSQLEEVAFDYYVFASSGFTPPHGPEFVYYFGWQSDPIFQFNSGELVGINFLSPPQYTLYIPKSDGTTSHRSEGYVTLSVRGNNFEELFTGTTTTIEYSEEGPVTYTENYQDFVSWTGTVEFKTLEAVEAGGIPESQPLTIFGAATLIGFGLLCKRKLI